MDTGSSCLPSFVVVNLKRPSAPVPNTVLPHWKALCRKKTGLNLESSISEKGIQLKKGLNDLFFRNFLMLLIITKNNGEIFDQISLNFLFNFREKFLGRGNTMLAPSVGTGFHGFRPP